MLEQANPAHARFLAELAEKCDAVALEEPDNAELFAQRHFDYHHGIAKCSGSPLLTQTLERVFLPTLMLYNANRGWGQGYGRMIHVQLNQAIFAGDPQHAVEAMRNHIERALRRELEVIAEAEKAATNRGPITVGPAV